jgi:hypothetical protein
VRPSPPIPPQTATPKERSQSKSRELLNAVIQAIPLTHEKMVQTSNTYLQKY